MNIEDLLIDIVDKEIQSDEVAVLMSGGVDSTSMAFCANRLGKKVHVYTFHLEGNESYDSKKAQEIARVFGWECTTVIVPTSNLEEDVLNLARNYQCEKKTHFECTFPFLYIYPEIREKYVLSGIGADGYYGITKKAILHWIDTKEKFDEYRIRNFTAKDVDGVTQQYILSKQYNKIYSHPYLWHKEVEDWFYQFDWKQLNKPVQKRHIREAFKEEYDRVGTVKPALNLQLCADIDHLFETLLDNPRLNTKGRTRVMDLLRDINNSVLRTSGPLDNFFT